jgi:hypothetical protein
VPVVSDVGEAKVPPVAFRHARPLRSGGDTRSWTIRITRRLDCRVILAFFFLIVVGRLCLLQIYKRSWAGVFEASKAN